MQVAVLCPGSVALMLKRLEMSQSVPVCDRLGGVAVEVVIVASVFGPGRLGLICCYGLDRRSNAWVEHGTNGQIS